MVASMSTLSRQISNCPPFGRIAYSALAQRFITTCWSWTGRLAASAGMRREGLAQLDCRRQRSAQQQRQRFLRDKLQDARLALLFTLATESEDLLHQMLRTSARNEILLQVVPLVAPRYEIP